jgi:hypothetical protein
MSEARKVQIRAYFDANELKQAVAINPVDLSNGFIDQAQLLTDYGIRSAKAARQVDDVKLILENTEAAVDRKLRDEAAAAGTKTTEPQIEKMIARHPKVIAVKRALNEAKQIEAIGKIAVESFRHRKDMLVQLGANERKEMEGELTMRTRETQQLRQTNDTNVVLAMRRKAAEGEQPN